MSVDRDREPEPLELFIERIERERPDELPVDVVWGLEPQPAISEYGYGRRAWIRMRVGERLKYERKPGGPVWKRVDRWTVGATKFKHSKRSGRRKRAKIRRSRASLGIGGDPDRLLAHRELQALRNPSSERYRKLAEARRAQPSRGGSSIRRSLL